MNITLLCTDRDHPVNSWILRWQKQHGGYHEITVCHDSRELPGGDILFLVSCGQIIDASTRGNYRHTLVLHASDLPKGRGWSPHVWELLEGADRITVTLLEAEDAVDTGSIWAKRSFLVPTHALYDEINECLFETELALMDDALQIAQGDFEPAPQDNDVVPTYYARRSPEDSEIDPTQPLSVLFNKIRVMDPHRYPAFFKLHGHTYTIEIKKVSSDDHD